MFSRFLGIEDKAVMRAQSCVHQRVLGIHMPTTPGRTVGMRCAAQFSSALAARFPNCRPSPTFKGPFRKRETKFDEGGTDEEKITCFQAHRGIVAAEFLWPCCGSERSCAAGIKYSKQSVGARRRFARSLRFSGTNSTHQYTTGSPFLFRRTGGRFGRGH